MKIQKDNRGIAHLGLIIGVVVVIGIVSLVYWRVSHQPKPTVNHQQEESQTDTESEEVAVSSEKPSQQEPVKKKPYPKVAIPENCTNYSHDTSAEAASRYEEIKEGILGKWVGCMTTPWVTPYKISIKFKSDGTYSAKYIGNEINSPNRPDWPALYYGVTYDTPAKTYTVNPPNSNGSATGTLVIAHESGIKMPGTLRDIRLTGNSLKIEFWESNTYGPLILGLVRANQE